MPTITLIDGTILTGEFFETEEISETEELFNTVDELLEDED